MAPEIFLRGKCDGRGYELQIGHLAIQAARANTRQKRVAARPALATTAAFRRL